MREIRDRVRGGLLEAARIAMSPARLPSEPVWESRTFKGAYQPG